MTLLQKQIVEDHIIATLQVVEMSVGLDSRRELRHDLGVRPGVDSPAEVMVSS